MEERNTHEIEGDRKAGLTRLGLKVFQRHEGTQTQGVYLFHHSFIICSIIHSFVCSFTKHLSTYYVLDANLGTGD